MYAIYIYMLTLTPNKTTPTDRHVWHTWSVWEKNIVTDPKRGNFTILLQYICLEPRQVPRKVGADLPVSMGPWPCPIF